MTRAPDLRLRHPTPGLLALPWDRPLATWDPDEVGLRELPVGPSRHLVRFAEVDGALWALKELPVAVAHREYDVLRTLEDRGLPAVRAAGLVEGVGDADTGVLLTRYLTGSWQYRRLFLRLPPNRAAHRARLLDAMAGLLVELHRHGVYWGDCSLANTLFSRDGQLLQAWLVDAETSEVHPSLSDGQRSMDLDILVENVAAGMVDVATWLGRPEELHEVLIAEAMRIPERYETLWSVLHQEPVFAFDDRYRVEATARELTDLGFVVDEVRLDPTGEAGPHGATVRLRIGTGSRRHHARLLAEVAGVDAGEGQARVLLGDLRAHREALSASPSMGGRRVTDGEAAPSWWHDVVVPGMRRAHQAVGHAGSALQAYCDLLEVRWLLSESAGRDVGTEEALAALADRAPVDSAARALVADTASDLPALLPDDPTVTPGT